MTLQELRELNLTRSIKLHKQTVADNYDRLRKKQLGAIQNYARLSKVVSLQVTI